MTKIIHEPPKRQDSVDRRFLNHPPSKKSTTLKPSRSSSRTSSPSPPSPKKQTRGLNRQKSSKKLIRNHIIHFNQTFNDDYDVATHIDKSTSTNSSHNDVQEKSSSSNDGDYVYEYIDVEDLLTILDQHKKNKTDKNTFKDQGKNVKKTEVKEELEYYDDDFYFDYDKPETNSTKNASSKTTENSVPKNKSDIDKKVSLKSNDYEYPGKQ